MDQRFVDLERIGEVALEEMDFGHRLAHQVTIFAAFDREPILPQRLRVVAFLPEREPEIVVCQLACLRDLGRGLVAQPLLGRSKELLEDPLASFVVHHEVGDRIALRRRVFGMRADVEVEAGAVGQEHVGAAAPRHDPAEEVARDLVGAEPALAAEGAGDAVLVLEPEDTPVHSFKR